MKRYDAVIFDLDGTLLNTLDDLTAAVNHALVSEGWPARTVEEVRSFVGNGFRLLMERATPAGADEEAIDRSLADFKTYYAAHMADATAPYPGVVALLKALGDKGYKLAVCSNKGDAAVKELVNTVYFPGLLHAAAGEDEAHGVPKKPHPAMLYRILDDLGSDPARAVFVGDADTDIQMARNAGLDSISVTWGFRTREFLLEHGAEALIDAPEELVGLV